VKYITQTFFARIAILLIAGFMTAAFLCLPSFTYAGSVTTASVSSLSRTKTLAGTATSTKAVFIKLYKEGSKHVVYKSKAIKVRNDVWKAKISKKLIEGTYTVEVRDGKKASASIIATSSLSVTGKKEVAKKSNSTLVVESVPLLFGGTVRGGGSVAVSYVQVINIGKEAASLQGFKVVQNGSAPTSAIAAFTSVDETGTLSGSTMTSKTPLFVKGLAFVPIEASFAPGQMRLFTIKAVLASDIRSSVGSQLMVALASVDANASVQGKVPVRGTTWTLAY
jgi:hypothetical protein